MNISNLPHDMDEAELKETGDGDAPRGSPGVGNLVTCSVDVT